MKNIRKYGIYVVLVVVPLLQLIFSSSHLDWLVGLQLVYIAALFLMFERRMLLVIALVVIGQSLVEIVNYQTLIGLGALSFFVSVLLCSFLFRVSTVFAADRKYTRGMIILFLAIIVEQVFSSIASEHANLLTVSSLLVNLFVFLLAAAVYSQIKGPSNALKS